jgi:serine/threonine-protein kinase
MVCLDQNTVAAFVEGLLAKTELAEVEQHVDACPACRRVLSHLAPLLEPPSTSNTTSRSLSRTTLTVSDAIPSERLKWEAAMRVGRVLRGKWRLDRLVGIGGTAAVYEATHQNHGGRVAIKILHPSLGLGQAERRRFLREGYAANSVKHPCIVRVLDDDIAEGGALFLVSDFVDGETLHARLCRLGKVPPSQVLAVAADVLDVLAVAHERGVIHRDIKPENILVSNDGETKLLDFGIALVGDLAFRGADSMTATGLLVGTPAFMPPEQARGDAVVGPLSDLWAVGATVFTLISGRLVHEMGTVTDTIRSVIEAPAPPLASVVPDIHPEIARVVDKALAFKPVDRWPSARAMQEAVRAAERALGLMEAERGVAPARRYVAPAADLGSSGRRRRTAAVSASIVLAGGLFVAAARDGNLLARLRNHDPRRLAPPAVPPATIPSFSAAEERIASPPGPIDSAGAVAEVPPNDVAPTTSPSRAPLHVATRPRQSPASRPPPPVPATSNWLDRRR